ncbi:MAG: 1-acyl-sn-glycerol-3-phosphate acyltransferase [Bacteroidetes bacterium]|nr:1-acyl-sn-glycerol-3-phosphate acyltransferase [Bacteroidota bacterium]
MKYLKRILQWVYAFLVLLTFVFSLIAAFPFFLLIGLNNNTKARKAIFFIVHNWAKVWLWLIGMPIHLRGLYPRGQKFVIVANHISYLDTVNIYAAIPDYFRTLGKKEMAQIPLFGFVYKQLAILVDRSNQESRAKSMRLMWRQIRTECPIAIFPEGTFNETNQPLKPFYDGAFRLAIHSQTPILPLLFLDTKDRFHYSAWWKLKPGKNRAVLLPPVYVNGMTKDDIPALKEKVWLVMTEKMIALKERNVQDKPS